MPGVRWVDVDWTRLDRTVPLHLVGRLQASRGRRIREPLANRAGDQWIWIAFTENVRESVCIFKNNARGAAWSTGASGRHTSS